VGTNIKNLCTAADDCAARVVLEETQRTSWQHIWIEEMADRFASVSKTAAEVRPAPENNPAASTAPVASDPTAPETTDWLGVRGGRPLSLGAASLTGSVLLS
jgi:hypothetical protein